MNANDGSQEITVKDLFAAAAVSGNLRAVRSERWMWPAMSEKDPILELVGNLRGRGICYPAVKNGKSTVEGILLTTASLERIVERVRAVCEEHFLRYQIEKSGTHLCLVVGGEEPFQPQRELFLFTSKFGDLAGLKFSIELKERWEWQSKPLVETLYELRDLGHEMIDYKEIQLEGRRSCAMRLAESAPRQEALLKIHELLDRSGWRSAKGAGQAAGPASFIFRKGRYLASVRLQDNDSNKEEVFILCQVSEESR